MGRMLADPAVVQAAVLVLVAALTALARLISSWVHKRTANENVVAVVDRALVEVQAAVAAVGQAYVDALKDANEDGEITADEAKEARARAVAIAKTNLGPAGVHRLVRALGIDAKDVDTWLGTHVEAAVRAEDSAVTP